MAAIFFQAIVLVVCISCDVRAAGLTPADTLTVSLLSATEISYEKTSQAMASEDALAYCGFIHRFSRNFAANVTLKASNAFVAPGIDRGSITWASSGLSIEGGIFTNRYGRSCLYKPHSLRNPFVENPLLLYDWGYGARALYAFRNSAIGGSVSINEREAGSAHITFRLAFPAFIGDLLAGFESYSVENQDNGAIAGFEFLFSWKSITVHPVGKYVYYFAYDRSRNPTMVPGHRIDGYIETKISATKSLTITDLLYAGEYHKRYDQRSLFNGVDCEWMFGRWIGVGAGLEAQKAAAATIAPEVFISIKPVADGADARISFRRSVTGRSSPVYGIDGTLWIGF
jgi:hypothetical protein